MGRIIRRPIQLPCAKGINATSLTLREYYNRRNKVLIIRQVSAIGDAVMMRMIFEDFKKIAPDIHITVGISDRMIPILAGHPFIDSVVSYVGLNHSLYGTVYDITSVDVRRETQTAPYGTENRSDIWASHCGLTLQTHNMHFNIPKQITSRCRRSLEQHASDKGKPIVLFTPAASIQSRTLDDKQAQGVIDGLRELGLQVVLFNRHILNTLDAPTIIAPTVDDFLGIINAADYIVSVDTGCFHAAGGMKKPLVGIFSWTDGKVYGKWYDFILVQRHRDHGGPAFCPCYYWPKCPLDNTNSVRKPCIINLMPQEIMEGVNKMFQKWPRSING